MPVMISTAVNRPSISPAKVEALSGSHQDMWSGLLLAGETEVRRLGGAGWHGACDGLPAVHLVPRLARVQSRLAPPERHPLRRAGAGVVRRRQTPPLSPGQQVH